jgi:hypothetical protein
MPRDASAGLVVRSDLTFNGVKVFSATMFAARDQLGETVTAWLTANPQLIVTDFVVTQSSDSQFHCVAITVFYWERLHSSRGGASCGAAGRRDRAAGPADPRPAGHALRQRDRAARRGRWPGP